MQRAAIIILVLVALVWWLRQPPSAARIIDDTRVSVNDDYVEYDGQRYLADWGKTTRHVGDVRVFTRAYHRVAPFVTHEAVLTTGDFSDPDLVEVSPIRKGSMSWSARTRPKGTLIVLHFVPADRDVLSRLELLREGDRVELAGHEVSDHRITAGLGRTLQVNGSNHKFLMVTGVEILGE